VALVLVVVAMGGPVGGLVTAARRLVLALGAFGLVGHGIVVHDACPPVVCHGLTAVVD
jgi:hypothetical protein